MGYRTRRSKTSAGAADDLFRLGAIGALLIVFVPALRDVAAGLLVVVAILAFGVVSLYTLYRLLLGRARPRVVPAEKSRVLAQADSGREVRPAYLGSGAVDETARRTSLSAQTFPYVVRPTFFSWTESSFYRALEVAVTGRYLIFPKVRLLDICDVSQTEQAAFNRVSAKHVDFLLCDRGSYKPVAAIEVDGSSHERADRIKRDAFVDELFAHLEVPLLRFRAEAGTRPLEIVRRLDAAGIPAGAGPTLPM